MRASPNGVPLSAADSSRPPEWATPPGNPLEVSAGEEVRPTGRGDIAVWPSGDTSGGPEGYFGLDLPALLRRIFFCRFRLSARRMLSQSNS